MKENSTKRKVKKECLNERNCKVGKRIKKEDCMKEGKKKFN